MSTADRIGEVVRFHRKESGLTQKELAVLADVGVSSVYAIERGRASVQMDTLLKVLSVLSITLTAEGPLMEAFSQRASTEDQTNDGGPRRTGQRH